MKYSFAQGIVIFYLVLMGLQMIVSGSSSTSATGVGAELHDYALPSELTAHTDPDTGQSSVEIGASTIASSIWNLGQMAVLYFPGVFQGNLVWFWWFICFPTAVAFWVVMFTIFRGVGST